jgi:hypothetical protein
MVSAFNSAICSPFSDAGWPPIRMDFRVCPGSSRCSA